MSKIRKKFREVELRFIKLNEKGFPIIDSNFSNEFRKFYDDMYNDYGRFFYDSVRELYKPLITMNMLSSLGLAISDMIAFKIGRENYDGRIHYVFALPSAGGKGSFDNATIKCAERLEKSYTTSGSEHDEALIGRIDSSLFDWKKNKDRYGLVENITYDKRSKQYYENIISEGIFRTFVFINSEASDILDGKLNTKESKTIYKYFCNALESLQKSYLTKSMTGGKMNLKYRTFTILHLYLQKQSISSDYFTKGVYRRAPIFTTIDLDLNDIEMIQDAEKTLNEIEPVNFYSILYTMRDKSKELKFDKKHIQYDPYEEIYIRDEGNENEKQIPVKINKYFSDEWELIDNSNIRFTQEAVIMIQLYLSKFYKSKDMFKVYMKEFKGISQMALKDLFRKFAFILQIAYVTNVEEKTPKEIVVDEEIIHIIAPEMELVFDSMFLHFQNNYSVEESLNLKPKESIIVKLLLLKKANNIETGIETKDLAEWFHQRTHASMSVFRTSLKNLTDREIVISHSTGKRKKGMAGVVFYLNENKI